MALKRNDEKLIGSAAGKVRVREDIQLIVDDADIPDIMVFGVAAGGIYRVEEHAKNN